MLLVSNQSSHACDEFLVDKIYSNSSKTVFLHLSLASFLYTAGQDYTATSQTVTFAPSETSRIVMVPIINDNVYEGLEQFTAQLSIPAGATGVMLGTADTATVDITDNDCESFVQPVIA